MTHKQCESKGLASSSLAGGKAPPPPMPEAPWSAAPMLSRWDWPQCR